MKYAKVVNSKVVQVQPYKESGFVQVPDNVVAGMIQEGDDFVNPPIPQEQIDQARISELKAYLASTDYINDKYKEEVELFASLTHDEFMTKHADVYTARVDARTEINTLEGN